MSKFWKFKTIKNQADPEKDEEEVIENVLFRIIAFSIH